MKKFILILACLYSLISFSQTSFSSEFSFSTGTPEKSIYRGTTGYRFTAHIYDGNKNIITVKSFNTQVTIQRHDVASLKEISRVTYEDLPDNSKIQNILSVKNKLVLYYTVVSKSNNTILYAREINNEGVLLNPIQCLETNGKIATFQFLKSTDKSKILIQYKKVSSNRIDSANYDILGFYAFTSDLIKISGSEIKMPLTKDLLDNMGYTICNSGSIYFISINTFAKKVELNTLNGSTIIHMPIQDLDSTFSKISFRKFLMSENLSGNLIISGYYINGIDIQHEFDRGPFSTRHEENVNGLFHFEISKSGEILAKIIYEFPIELLNQNENSSAQNKNLKNEKKDNGGIPNLQVIKVVENTNGSILVIGMQVTFVGFLDGYPSFTLGHIIVYKLDAQKKLAWITKIPKLTSTPFLYSSNEGFIYNFSYYKYENVDYIFFADEQLNSTITDNTDPKVFSEVNNSGNLVVCKMDDTTGKYSRNSVLDINNINGIDGTYFFRNNFVQIAPNVLLIEILTDKGTEVFIEMKLK